MPQAIFVVLSALLLFGQSQPPSPTPSELSQKKQDETPEKQAIGNANKKPASQASASANQIDSKPQGGEESQGAKYSEKTTARSGIDWPSWVVAIFTAVLAVVAGLQLWAMHKQAESMREGLIETKKAADAARDSAEYTRRGLEISQGPNVVISSIVLNDEGQRTLSPDENLSNSWVEISLKNTGPTRAVFLRLEYTVIIEDMEDLIGKPGIITTEPTDLPREVPFVKRSQCIGELFPDIENIGSGPVVDDRNLKVVGCIRYHSIFSERLRVDFDARINPSRVLPHEGTHLLSFDVTSTLKSDPEA